MALTVAPGAVGGHQTGTCSWDNPRFDAFAAAPASLAIEVSFTFYDCSRPNVLSASTIPRSLIAPDVNSPQEAVTPAKSRAAATRMRAAEVFNRVAIVKRPANSVSNPVCREAS